MQLIKKFWNWVMSVRIINFMIVGGLGFVVGTVFVNMPITWALHHVSSIHEVYYLPALIPSSIVSITWNYYLNLKWTFKDRKAESVSLLRYELMGMSTVILDIALLWILVKYAHITAGVFNVPIIALVIATVCMFLLRYLISNIWIWRVRSTMS